MSSNQHSVSTARLSGNRGNGHGRIASWILVAVVIAAFAVGGISLVDHMWDVFWACVAVVVLSVPVGRLIGIMDDTLS